MDLKFIPQLKQSNSPLHKEATDVDIHEISKLMQNQKVNITGRISLGSLEPKKVEVKSSHQVLKVKEDCLIEDKTGHGAIHIWGDLIEKLVHGKSYKLANLNIKTFQGKTYVTTTAAMTYEEVKIELENPVHVGAEMIKQEDTKITAPCLKFVTKLEVFTACQVCRKRLDNDVSSETVKCKYCKSRQPKKRM